MLNKLMRLDHPPDWDVLFTSNFSNSVRSILVQRLTGKANTFYYQGSEVYPESISVRTVVCLSEVCRLKIIVL